MKLLGRAICLALCTITAVIIFSGCAIKQIQPVTTAAAVVQYSSATVAVTTAAKTETQTETQTKAKTQAPTKVKTTAKPKVTTIKTKPNMANAEKTLRAWAEKKKTLPAHEKEGEAFFKGAVFVGDSVTVGLKNYVKRERNKGKSCLANAEFLCSSSHSYANAQRAVDAKNSTHPKYNGKAAPVQENLKLIGAKKVFIMLGMNDFSAYGAEKTRSKVILLLSQIVEKSPDIDIYIESVTPIIKGMEKKKFNNAGILKFNDMLKEVCKEYGITYVDIASIMKTEDGYLRNDYCGDPKGIGIHMSYKATAAWVDYLVKSF